MVAIKILVCATLLTTIGITTADASLKALVPSAKTHLEIQNRLEKVTVSNDRIPSKSRTTFLCSAIRGVSYAAALVGLQSLAISLPSMATAAGVAVAGVAVGVGALSAGISIATMIANDKLCTWERIIR